VCGTAGSDAGVWRYATSWLLLSCLVTSAARAQETCQPDSACRFKKPNIVFVLDYSSSMVGRADAPAYFPEGQTQTTRWLAELDAVSEILRYDKGFFANNTRLALARFAHDPMVQMSGTTLSTDVSFPPITDGFAVDVPFDGSNGDFLECRGSGVEAEVELLRRQPPPAIGDQASPTTMMLTWTRGALRSTREFIEQTRQSHVGEPGEDSRTYEVVLMTDGEWSCPDMIGQGCDENPAPEAAALRQAGIRLHVVAFADAAMQPSLDELALQGGTVNSIAATSPKGIVDALGSALDTIRDSVIVPECTRGLPRILVIMDGSSSMLDGSTAGATKWDKARYALAGNPQAPNPSDPGYVEPVFDREIEVGGRLVAIEDVVHLGLIAFAGADTQTQLVGFGPCMRDNFAWAMDPLTSCEAPGCDDPYAGYPIEWTFKDSQVDRDPAFVRPTRSYMPACNQTAGLGGCVGLIPNTFTGQGLEFARGMIDDYKRAPAPFHIASDTPFVNVLITDGETSDGSSDVRAALQGMVAEGIETHVIGFGSAAELDEAQLGRYAVWGDTDAPIIVDPSQADGANALADALAGIVTGLTLDGCCVLQDCSAEPEPSDPNAVCGDGKIENGEVCDDGALNATYGHCGGRCDGPHLICGDMRVDTPEECDDGNTAADDGCDPLCLREDQTRAGGEDGGLVVPPALNRPPVARPAPSASVPPNAMSPTTSAPALTPPSGPQRKPSWPAPRARGGSGCTAGSNGKAVSPIGLALASLAWLRLRRRRRGDARASGAG
jgi:cysteine-rich repeat protein